MFMLGNNYTFCGPEMAFSWTETDSSWTKSGPQKHKPLKPNKKPKVVQSKPPFRTTNPLILLSETPLQLQLRKCVFLIGPQGRNPISSRFPSVTSAPLLPKSRAGLGPPLSWWSSLQPSDRH